LTFPIKRFLALGAAFGLALASVGNVAAAGSHAPREVLMPPRGAASHSRPVRSSNLSFHGGNPGVVKGTDKVYLVFWGTGWSSDPSGEAGILQSFFGHVGGSSWNNSVTQYCDGVAVGTITCGTSGNHATNPSTVLGGTWSDTTNAAPTHPSQADLAGEAARAAAHFNNNATANLTAQYVIATATGNSASGFGTSYCAWHSSTSSANGTLAYTNLPYITDAGASCGANFNGLGATAGITIVEGHEFAETETDIFPNGGWLDSKGAENGDKCAWISSGPGASARVQMGNASFPVQSLWSNASSGCVLSYP
jgi:serine protease